MTHSLRVTKSKPELIGQRPIIIIYQVLPSIIYETVQ